MTVPVVQRRRPLPARPRHPAAPSADARGLLGLQRAAGNQAVSGLVVQRHAGFRTKPRLETPALDTPALQTAASSAERALEARVSSGDPVTRLQEALTAAGLAVAVTSRYDAATQRAVAAFQSAHGIPFPTGRQSGPKTLSTLDDHLLGGAGPTPPPGCTSYQPGEREASLAGPGTASRSGGLGQELRLANFGAGRNRMKPEHEVALRQFVKDFDLFEPLAAFEVEFVRGFTDAVDEEARNLLLREERAIDVSFVLGQSGVPGLPPAQAAAEGSYDAGCDPAGRSAARSVLVRLRRKPVVPPVPPPPPAIFPGCGAPLSARLEAAIPGAVANLRTTIAQLRNRPLGQTTKDGLFVYFRREDEATAGAVAAQLEKSANGLASNAPVDCKALVGCGPGTHAVTNLITRVIHICNGGALDPDAPNLERTLAHEGMHLFAGLGALGELSHGDAPECDEGDLAGQTSFVRLQNADSYAALASRLAKSPGGLARRSGHFRGDDLALATTPKNASAVRLTDAPDRPEFRIQPVSDLGPTLQWRLADDLGRNYLLLNIQGEIVDPSVATDATVVRIGRKTRDLLAARGVAVGTLSVHVRNAAGLDRTVALGLTFER